MCNLYLMYYSKADDGGFELCDIEENRNITKLLKSMLNENFSEDSDRDQTIVNSRFVDTNQNKFIRPDRLM